MKVIHQICNEVFLWKIFIKQLLLSYNFSSFRISHWVFSHLLVCSTVHHGILGIHLQLQRQFYIQTQLPWWFLNRHLHTSNTNPTLPVSHITQSWYHAIEDIYQILESLKTLDKEKGYEMRSLMMKPGWNYIFLLSIYTMWFWICCWQL